MDRRHRGEPRQSRRRPVWGAALLLLFLAAACGDKNVYAPPPPPKVMVSHPVRREVTDYLEFTGNTQAINTVQLRARVEGYLEAALFKDGENLKKGQLVFLIQPNTYMAKLKEAEAEIQAQKARLTQSQTELARNLTLVQKKAASQSEVDRWRYEQDAAAAALQAAEARRDLAKLNLSYTRVTAPFDGRIDRRLKDVGNLVGSGESTVLAEINQIDPIYVYFNISERDLLRLMDYSQDMPGNVKAKSIPVSVGLADEKGFPHQGYLDFAAISLDSTTGTQLFRGILANPDGKLVPGLFARVRIPLNQNRSALLVPQVALSYDQQGPFVLVVNDKNLVERRPVKVGPPVDNLRIVEEGLQGDEWVITTNLIRAIPGRPVTPERQEPEASGPASTDAATPPQKAKTGP